MIMSRWAINKDKKIIMINPQRPCEKQDNLSYCEFNLNIRPSEYLPYKDLDRLIRVHLTKWNRLMVVLVFIKVYGEFKYGD